MAEHYYQTYHGSNARKTVLVVTPTMDGPFLQEAIQSVQQQETQYTFDHLLVYDGVQPKVTRGILPKYQKDGVTMEYRKKRFLWPSYLCLY